MKKFAVFGLLTILLISFGSCRNEEILEDKENSKQQLELINSKSLWKENITFISKAKKSFEKRVNKKYFINAHGFPLWEYSLSFEKDNEPYIFVPIFKKGEITEVLLIVKKEEKIFLYYVKEKSKIEFFNILIYGNAHASNRNTSHLRVYCGWRTFEWIWENNDGSTDTNYTTEYFCLDINEASIDYNTDGGGGIMLGDYIGGSDWGPPIDLPLLKDPCKKIKTNLTDTKFTEKVSSLNNSTTFNYDHEMGFASSYAPAGTNLGTQYQPMDNKIGTHSVRLPDGDRFFGFMHTHNNEDGVIKIFSPADIMTFLTSCVGNASTNGNIGDAYSMVITSEGSYMLQYTGTTSNFTSLSSSLSNWNSQYREDLLKIMNEDGTFTQSNVENTFLQFLKNTVNIDGLELYKVDGTTSKKLSLNSNNTTNTTPCP